MNKFTFLILVLISISCASLKKTDIPDSTSRIDFEPLQIKLDYDVFLLRVDLYRPIKTTTDTESITAHDTGDDSVPYHYIGVNLGNGIFLDANKNLSLNLVKLLKIIHKKNFIIKKKGTGLLTSDTTYIKKDSNFTIDYGEIISGNTEIDLKKNGALISEGVVASDQEIIVEPEKIKYKPHGIFRTWPKLYIIKTASGARIPRCWNNKEIKKNKDGSINLGKALKVRNTGKQIIITFSKWFGPDEEFYMVRSKNRIVVFNKKYQGIKIDILDKKVSVTYVKNGFSKIEEFEIVE